MSAATGMQGRVALIAGAGGGIGMAIARRLAAEGAVLALVDRDGARLREQAADLPGAQILGYDLTDEQAVDAAVREVVAQHGRVDVMVHCVGMVGPSVPVHEMAVADWDQTVAVNLRSAFLCTRAVVPAMLNNDYGRIVLIASIAGKEGNANQAAYSAAKAAVIGLTKSQGKELARTGIRVNAIAPAVIQTPLVDQMSPALRDAVLARIPMGRPGLPEEVAQLAAWLASEACSFSTGATFDLSGGRATY